MPVLLDAGGPFHVPPRHRLVPVRPRSRWGLIRATFGEHEAYDTSDRLIARLETFDETGRTGSTKSGGRRYDGVGRLVDTGNLTRDKAGPAGSSLTACRLQPINRRQAR